MVTRLDSDGFGMKLLRVSSSLAVAVTDDSQEGYGWLMFLKLECWFKPSLRHCSVTLSSF
jgi:hypothetical protein